MHCVEKAADIYLRILSAGGAKQTMTTENFVAIAALFGLTLPRSSSRIDPGEPRRSRVERFFRIFS